MADRKDGLPHPVTVGEAYLAAILDEPRGLRVELRPPPVIITEDQVMNVKEPDVAPGKRGRK